MTGDSDLFFDSKLDAQGGNLTMKKKFYLNLLDILNLITCMIYGE